MDGALAFSLHALTARLDRAADRYLRVEYGLSYRRFLLLFMVERMEMPTQRALAESLGVTEPSVSRMTATLVAGGLLEARADPAGGNRRGLLLTSAGRKLVQACGKLLEERLAELVRGSGVSYQLYTHQTRQLLAVLDVHEQAPADRRRATTETGVLSETDPARMPGRGET
jgi:DNA-binding MarR family transcriptional regulator